MAVVAALAALACLSPAWAQEMEPRSYSPSPIGMNFIAVVLGNSQGGVLFDPTLPITDVDANLDSASFGYARSIPFGRLQGQVAAAIPYVIGTLEGNVAEQAQSIRRSGFADMRLRMSVNLLGTKAMTREEFSKAPKKTILGVSLSVQAPTGQYEPTRLINLGTNRWAFKPEVGVSVPAGRWFLDAYLGTWFFTDNDRFYTGNSTRKQDPLTVFQAHASYVFKSRAWVAIDGVWYGGGASTVDANPPSERQSNSRFGATFAAPITPSQSIKFAFSTGATTRLGSDFDSIVVAWQFAFFDRPRK